MPNNPSLKGTADYILGDEDNLRNPLEKGTQEWSEQQNDSELQTTNAQAPAKKPANETKVASTQNAEEPKYRSALEFLEDAKKRVQEETADRNKDIEKTRQRNYRLAALNDGISALSNLLFTSLGAPDAYDPRNNMSDKFKARYDELYKANDAADRKLVNDYYNALVSDYNQELNSYLRKKAEKKAKEKEERELAYRKEKDEYQREKDKWEQDFKESKQKSEERAKANTLAVRTAIANVRASSSGNNSKKPTHVSLLDSDGRRVAIDDRLWTGGNAMQLLFEALVQDGVGRRDKESDRLYRMRIDEMDTKEKKAEFVKQNWYKSENAMELALLFSEADLSAGSEGDDPFSKYIVDGDEEDFSSYRVK